MICYNAGTHRAGEEMLNEQGQYVYMYDLREMGQCRRQVPAVVPEPVGVVCTPLHHEAWQEELLTHPDKEFKETILVEGFRVGYSYKSHTCRSVASNMHSALVYPEPIDSYIVKELKAGRIIGPLSKGRDGIHVSCFGVILKPHQPGRWRLITDLSPSPNSVNDGISPHICSLSYASIDDAIQHLMHLGPCAQMAKFDIAWVVPVHPQDRLLLGMVWRGELYVDGALPFGLTSAPKIFSTVADTLLWIMGHHGVAHAIHYLDAAGPSP